MHAFSVDYADEDELIDEAQTFDISLRDHAKFWKCFFVFSCFFLEIRGNNTINLEIVCVLFQVNCLKLKCLKMNMI